MLKPRPNSHMTFYMYLMRASDRLTPEGYIRTKTYLQYSNNGIIISWYDFVDVHEAMYRAGICQRVKKYPLVVYKEK